MKYSVVVAAEAEDDLSAIHRYVTVSESHARAEALLTKLLAACRRLERFPSRGHYVWELERLGVVEFREIVSAPHRIIYEIEGNTVVIHAVLDGRRDLQDLLAARLLR